MIQSIYTRMCAPQELDPTAPLVPLFEALEDSEAIRTLGDNPTASLLASYAEDEKAIKRLYPWRRAAGLVRVMSLAEHIISQAKERDARFVVFAMHRDFVRYLSAALVSLKAVTAWGGQKESKRNRHFHRFINDHECKVLVTNMKSAELLEPPEGLHLVCDDLMIAEPSWKPETNEAAIRWLLPPPRPSDLGSAGWQEVPREKPLRVEIAATPGTDYEAARIMCIEARKSFGLPS